MADPAAATPLDPDEARLLLAPLARARAVVLAVSGGPDSVALMHLAADVAARDPTFASLTVATVDHGLRAGSRDEAEAVMTASRNLGLPCHLLHWDGLKPTTRLQETARHHRYALLVACARRVGATHLVTAHTRDDQAETVLFRLMRGSGITGLSGIREQVERDGITHLRPFLDVPKARLVATCAANRWDTVEDPANSDPRFARSRLRALLPALAAEGLDAARFTQIARRMAEADAAIDAMARRALDAARLAPGRYNADRLFAEPSAVRCRGLGILLADLGLATGRPRLDRLEALTSALGDAHAAHRPLRRTLRGALVAYDGRGAVTISPHPPRRPAKDRPGGS